MQHAPEEYGEYWAGAVRIAAGIVFALLVHRLVQPLIELPPWPPTLLGWFVLAGAILVGSFAGALGLARIVATASRRR